MKLDRAILIAFLGNYVINTVLAAIVALVPASATGGIFTAQYITFVVLSAITVGVLTWWYSARDLKAGVIFGVVGFAVAIATAFVTGVSGVLSQTGSFSAVVGVLPNFWPFLANWSTLVLAGYWIIPAAALGWYMQPKAAPMGSPTM
jgi:hypothetical protein